MTEDEEFEIKKEKLRLELLAFSESVFKDGKGNEKQRILDFIKEKSK